MKIVQVNNHQRSYGGEDVIIEETCNVLKENHHEVLIYQRDSKTITGLFEKIHAFQSSLYCRSSRSEFVAILNDEKPDIVHIHNVYPLISPSILFACKEKSIPVVMRCANFRLMCPTLYFLDGSNIICEKCKNGKEYWCVIKNCRRNSAESVAYALRGFVSRKFNQFTENVTLYICPSEFVKQKLICGGFNPDRIAVLPNTVSLQVAGVKKASGEYVAYVGRMSREKGVETLLSAARQTGLPVRLAGDVSTMPEIVETAPENVRFMGHLTRDELVEFYHKARFLVLPSICYETFGIVLIEAMANGLPTIASRIGGIPEVVEDGVTGLLFEAGNADELAEKMEVLWNSNSLCRKMGEAGRLAMMKKFNKLSYYHSLIELYNRAIAIERKQIPLVDSAD